MRLQFGQHHYFYTKNSFVSSQSVAFFCFNWMLIKSHNIFFVYSCSTAQLLFAISKRISIISTSIYTKLADAKINVNMQFKVFSKRIMIDLYSMSSINKIKNAVFGLYN